MKFGLFYLPTYMPDPRSSSGHALINPRCRLTPEADIVWGPRHVRELHEDLRAWIESPAIELRDYCNDVVVQRRVGRMLAGFSTKPPALRAK
jgi:hypothetical protein